MTIGMIEMIGAMTDASHMDAKMASAGRGAGVGGAIIMASATQRDVMVLATSIAGEIETAGPPDARASATVEGPSERFCAHLLAYFPNIIIYWVITLNFYNLRALNAKGFVYS